jgi:hypothetical protein
MKRFLQGVDFVAKPPWVWSHILAVLGVCVGLCVVGFCVYDERRLFNALTAQYEALQDEVARAKQPIGAVDLSREKAILEQYSALQKVRLALAQDLQVFSALELCAGKDFVFLAVKPNSVLNEVSLSVEVRNMAQLSEGLTCLESTEAWAWIRLQSQQRVPDDVQQPLRVELVAGVSG